ncbi:MAG: hypothetical protein LBD24_07695 [Spirochaetaceae bacterium]|nr:hypothetical protein [Spirochaetaceae bacterium]
MTEIQVYNAGTRGGILWIRHSKYRLVNELPSSTVSKASCEARQSRRRRREA